LVERRATEPLLRPSWLMRRDVGAPVAVNVFAHVALMGLSVTSPFLLQRLWGYGTGVVALLTGIRPAAFSVAASLSARHVRAMGSRRVLLAGNTVLTVGCVLTAVAVLHHSIVILVVSIVLTGFGVGYGRPSLVTTITNAVADDDVGAVNGMLSMAGQLGSSLGQTLLVAIIGTSAAATTFADTAWTVAASAALAVVMTTLIVDERATEPWRRLARSGASRNARGASRNAGDASARRDDLRSPAH
jgi:MFS family permease